MRFMKFLFVASLMGTTCLSSALAADEKANKPARALKLSAELPKDPPTLSAVNLGQFVIDVKLENAGTEEALLFPFLAVELLDGDGKLVPRSINLGRWGLRKAGSPLEQIRFIPLKPGESHVFKVNFARYMSDSEFIYGWRVQAAGEYKLTLHYHYDRADAKKRFGKGCETIDDPKADWNRALEVNQKLELNFRANASN